MRLALPFGMQSLGWHGQTLTRVITMLSIATSTLFLAQGAGYIATGLMLHPRFARSSAVETSHPPGSDLPDATAILARNIFDATVGPLWPRRPKLVDPAAPIAQGDAMPRCEGSLRMLGAMYLADFPEWSFATFGTNVQSALYHPGELVDDKQIVQILPRAALLRRNGGGFCSVAMFVDHTTEIAQSTDPSELAHGIAAVSDTSFRIQKTLVDRILQEPARFAGSVRIGPHEEGGRLAGVKVYGVRRDSLLGKLGIQNGDLLRSANGVDLTDPSAALEAYALLRSASHLSVAIVRRGQPLTLTYDLQ